MIKFSKCCTPVPGDDIIGFITKGFGVSVHRRDCPNVHLDDPNQHGRWVNVTWADEIDCTYQTTLSVESSDRTGMWLDISSVLAGMKLKVTEFSGRDVGEGRSVTTLTIEVADLAQLETVIRKLRNISGVTAVLRHSV